MNKCIAKYMAKSFAKFMLIALPTVFGLYGLGWLLGWLSVNVFHWESHPHIDAGFWYYFLGGLVSIFIFAVACLPVLIVWAWIAMWYESAKKACGINEESKQ